MNTRVVVTILAAALVIGGAFVYLAVNNSAPDAAAPMPPAVAPSDVATVEPQDPDEPTETEPVAAGSYTNYSQAGFAAASGTRVLFFHANWCPQCRALDEDLLAKGAPDGLTVFKVDYDNSDELRQQYGVTIQTSVVFVEDDGSFVTEILYDDPSVESLRAARP